MIHNKKVDESMNKILEQYYDVFAGTINIPISVVSEDSEVSKALLGVLEKENGSLTILLKENGYEEDFYSIVLNSFKELSELEPVVTRLYKRMKLMPKYVIPIEDYARSIKIQKLLDKMLVDFMKKENSVDGYHGCVTYRKGYFVFGEYSY